MAPWHKAAPAGVLAVIISLGLVSWLDSREQTTRLSDLKRETEITAHQFAARLEGGLERHLISMAAIANFMANTDHVTEAQFDNFAAATMKMTPLCRRIPFVDSNWHVRWVHPLEPNRHLVGFDVRTHAEGQEANLRAMETKQPALSAPLQLVGGARGFILAVPIFRQDVFLGNIICSFVTSEFFASVAIPGVMERYEESVQDSGVLLFDSGSMDESHVPDSAAVNNFSLGGRTWEIQMRPQHKVALARLQSGRLAFWTLGSLLALLVGGFVTAGTYCLFRTSIHLDAERQNLRATRAQLDGAMHQLLQAEKLTALGELVAGVAHEINNPLSTIMGYSQLLMAKDLPAEFRRRLETMHSEAARMAKIVSNLLTFARKHPPEKKHLGLNGIIEKTLELKAYHFRVNQINVEKDLAADLPKTMMDFHQMQQVILNLLNNAEQALVESGAGKTIRLTTRRMGDRIEARVADDGPGIPPEIQTRVFEPFFTTKKDGKGTGLGLSLCYGIVQEHGGQIRLESRPGEGAAFLIDLPVVEDASDAPPPGASGTAASVRSLRVLVIDDESNVQDLLVDILRSRGHAVDTASDVPEALQKIAAGGHDLIISDMKMPHGSGKDIYRAVSEKDPRLANRIIFTTGDGASAETKRFLRDAGNEIVLKPFAIEAIETAIANAIRNERP